MKGQPIAYETLLAYAAGELAEAEAAPIAARLDEEPGAAATVALYRAVRDTVAADDSVAPPTALLARAKGIFPRHQREATGPLASLRRVVATLSVDSRSGLALAGFRGGAADAYQLAYESDAGDIDLQFEPDADPAALWRLLGQVSLDNEVPGVRVALSQPGAAAPSYEAEADPYGVFSAQVMPGTYELTVTLPTAVVVVPELEVG